MSWRSILIQNPARVRLKNSQLALSNDNGEYTIPIEDIAVIILDSPEITITSAVLSYMQDEGVVIITCDKSHIPNGLLLPFIPHSRNAQVANIQIGWSAAFKKRAWQKIIQNKIYNQGECLKKFGIEGSDKLFAMVKKVRSGDEGNLEAQAAKYYWQKLFESEFRRGDSDIINSALNYGYAVVRACVARSLVSYGLLPVFGLHHSSELNGFNLADDIIEIFRPFVDCKVKQMVIDEELSQENSRLTKENRSKLAEIAGLNVDINEESFSIIAVCDKISASLVSAVKAKDASILPKIGFDFYLSG